MVRKSNQVKSELIAAVAAAVARFQEATDAIDDAAAKALGLNRTDLRALAMLSRSESLLASELATVLGLTRGATTTVLDRLHQSGYAERVPDEHDRRGVRIQITASAGKAIESIWGPIQQAGELLLDSYGVAELEAILKFLQDGQRVQASQVERVQRLALKPRPKARAGKPARVLRERQKSRSAE